MSSEGMWGLQIKEGHGVLLQGEIFIVFNINTNVPKKRDLKRHVDCG